MKFLGISLLLASIYSSAVSADTGALKVVSVNQYACINFGSDINGDIVKSSSARKYYYFTKYNSPDPLGTIYENRTNCTGMDVPDNSELPRLDLISNYIKLWDRNDSRFQNLEINHIIRERLFSEYNIDTPINLFHEIYLPNSPATEASFQSSNGQLGFMMIPFTDRNGRTYCPGISEYQSDSPFLNILREYMGDTEGLYMANKETENIQSGTGIALIDATQMITESNLLKFGFYMKDGKKVKADAASFHSKNISYYYPYDESMDPLEKGSRKLFSIVHINGTWGPNITTDRRIGCIPKIGN